MIRELPLSSDPAQVFAMQIDDAKYIVDVRYNDRSGVWTLDLYESATQALIVASLPLVIGQDLLEPYNFSIGSLLCVDTTGQGINAGADELGSRVKVYWASPDEVVA